MKEQLMQYIKLLFAGTTDTEDIQQEILQNTLERYDDLIEQGKTPQAAYQLSICGIGDINELLGNMQKSEEYALPAGTPASKSVRTVSEMEKAIHSIILPIGLCVYFLISFATQAWYITWVVFPIMAAVKGLIKACFDLKEASKHEN